MFVSYVREDAPQVDRLCRVLEAAEVPYWRDKDSLWPGDQWKAKIREAIRSESLVFLACFSERSRARDKSHMNEELTLAVEEFRKLAPGKTWLIPVRFDAGPVQEWDLGAGRALSDLNYVDLFGDAEPVQVARLVATIRRLMGDDGPDAATVQAALDQVADADRPEHLRRLVKEMLPDPTRRIELDDTVRGEGRRVLNALRDEARFPVDSLPGTDEERLAVVVGQAIDMWRVVEPFVTTLEVAVRWAEPSQLQPWASTIQSLAAEAGKPRSGMTALLGLRYLPGTVGVMSVGMTAVQSGRWDNLKVLLVDPTTVASRGERPRILLDVFHPWAAFRDSGEWVPYTLARTAQHGEDPRTAAAAANKRTSKFYTPVAEWLYGVLRPGLADLYPDDDAYARDFDTAEVMLGLVSQDEANQQNAVAPDRYFPAHSTWFGRSTWRANGYGPDPLARIRDELVRQGSAWPPLRAGLFGGDHDRAAAALDAYAESFQAAARERH